MDVDDVVPDPEVIKKQQQLQQMLRQLRGMSDGRRTVIRSGALKAGDQVVVEDLKGAPKPAAGNQPFRMRF